MFGKIVVTSKQRSGWTKHFIVLTVKSIDNIFKKINEPTHLQNSIYIYIYIDSSN